MIQSYQRWYLPREFSSSEEGAPAWYEAATAGGRPYAQDAERSSAQHGRNSVTTPVTVQKSTVVSGLTQREVSGQRQDSIPGCASMKDVLAKVNRSNRCEPASSRAHGNAVMHCQSSEHDNVREIVIQSGERGRTSFGARQARYQVRIGLGMPGPITGSSSLLSTGSRLTVTSACGLSRTVSASCAVSKRNRAGSRRRASFTLIMITKQAGYGTCYAETAMSAWETSRTTRSCSGLRRRTSSVTGQVH